jgi:hypothetical protein
MRKSLRAKDHRAKRALGALTVSGLLLATLIGLTPAKGAVVNGCDDSGTTYPSTLTAGFGGGDGTSATPWLICSRAQLDGIDTNSVTLAAHYLLKSDLNLGGSGSPWTPLTGLFYGTLNGGGFTISGLYVSNSAIDSIGLFADLGDGAKIEQLAFSGARLESTTTSTTATAGTIAGRARGEVTVEKVWISDTRISGTAVNAGALFGDTSTPENSKRKVIANLVKISGSQIATSRDANVPNLGGVIGRSGSVDFSRVAVSATITNTGDATTIYSTFGGFVGQVASFTGVSTVISESSVDVSVSQAVNDSPKFGFLVGDAQSSTFSNISVEGSVTLAGSNSLTHGLTGFESGALSFKNIVMAADATSRGGIKAVSYGSHTTSQIYFLKDTGINTSMSNSNGGVAKTVAQLKTASTFPTTGVTDNWKIAATDSTAVTTSWSLGDATDPIWKIAEGVSYPELVWLDFFDNLFMKLSFTSGTVTTYPGETFVASATLPEGAPSTTYVLVNAPAPFSILSSGAIIQTSAPASTSYLVHVRATQATRGLVANVFVPVTVSDGILTTTDTAISGGIGPKIGETIWASAYERHLSADILISGSPVDEYVYRITTVENDDAASVDYQSATGYDLLTKQEQQTWYDNEWDGANYQFNWNAFICSGEGGEYELPLTLSLKYKSIEEIFTGTTISPDDNADLRKYAASASRSTPSKLSVVGERNSNVRGNWLDDDVAYGFSEVQGSCRDDLILIPFTITDENNQPLTSKSLVLGSEVYLEGVAFDAAGLTIGVTGGSSASFNAALWGVTTIQPAASGANTIPYVGPVATSISPALPGDIVYVRGNTLNTVTAVEVAGQRIAVTDASGSGFSFTLPASATAGSMDLKIMSSFGALTVQNGLRVLTAAQTPKVVRGQWTKLQPGRDAAKDAVKLYAKEPIGIGKLQYFVNGKEVAWIRALDANDPKLSFASGTPYLVRTVYLSPGKNRFEIKLDGVRVWRATYVPKG